MNSRKPKQNVEHNGETFSERLQLALALPGSKPAARPADLSQHAKVEIKIELGAPQIRSRLH